MRLDENAIAVTGIACRYPGASNPRQFWENILTRRRQFRRIPDRRLPLSDYHDPDPSAVDKTYGTRAAVLDGFEFDWVHWRIPRTTFESTDIVHWLALDVAQRAFEDAGYSKGAIPTLRAGVILGNTLTGEQSRSQLLRLRWPYVRRALLASARARGLPERQAAALAETMEAYYKSVFAPITEDSLAGGLSNTIAGRICNYFDLHGGGYSVDGACSSSLIAVATAARSLAQGDLDLALAGGVDVSLDTFELIGFAKTGALSATDMRVYDRKANGFIPGEGCGFVVLKRLKDARADGDYVYATFSGWGLSSDGKGGITAPSSGGQSMALSRAFTRASHGTKAPDFVEGHGTGTPVGDREELKGVAMALGDLGETPLRPCGITSVKSLIGHTKAAAGIAGFLKAVMAVNRRVLPPTAGCSDPNPVFEKEAKYLYPVLRGEVRPATSTLRAGVSAMGFGGINSHVTLESADPPAAHLKPLPSPQLDERALLASSQESELFVLASASAEELLQRIRDLSRMAELMSEAEMVDLAAQMGGEIRPGAPLRAAIVAHSPAALGDALDELEQMLLENAPPPGKTIGNRRKGVWLGNGGKVPRLGFLFPGQGSQKLNMARKLVERHLWARELLAQVLQWLQSQGRPSGFASGSFADLLYRPLERALDEEQVKAWTSALTRTEIAQPALCLSSLLWLGRLERLGLRPTAVGGHSLGELTAFHAAGAFDAQALVGLAAVRGEAMSGPDGQTGTMASLACSLEQAEALLDQVEGYVVVANINSPTQIVVSGEKAALAHLLSQAREQNILVRELPVSNAFHSRLVAAAAERLRGDLPLPQRLGPLGARLLSGIDGREIRPGIDLKEHFARQIVAPVDFVSLVGRMAEVCDLLVEVGPGRVLSGLVETILGDEEHCFTVESKAEADADLNLLLGNYFARGGEVNWEELYAGRLVRPFVPAWEMSFIENPCERPFDLSTDARAGEGGRQGSGAVPVSPEPGESSIAGLLGLPMEAMETYLSRRGPFLRAVVKADMEHLSDLLPPEPEPTVAPGETGGFAPPRAGEGAPDSSEASASERLFHLVAARSGFPRSTLSPELRLLDDLNLDSIKAAALIAEVAAQLGVAGQLDPAEFANASLQTIAEVLGNLAMPRRGDNSQAGESALADAKPQAAKRSTWVRDFAFEPTPEDLPADSPRNDFQYLAGEALILSEEGEGDLAAALSERLRRNGCGASQFPFSFQPGGDGRFTTFVAILPRLPDSSRSLGERLPGLVERLRAPLRGLASVRDPVNPVAVVYVQFGGGFFGKGSVPADVEQCCATALAASLHLERPELRVRILDFSPEISPAALSERVWAELATPEHYAAVGYDGEMTRRVPRPRLLEPGGYVSRPFSWSVDDVVLVTGGAKGITAECAFALARETGVRLALVGSSAPGRETPGHGGSSETGKTLQRFREAGLTVRYYQCDVTDAEAVESLVRKVRGELGEISAVIHGAGLNKPAALDRVSSKEAIREVSPKVLGAANLCHALEMERAPLKLFIAFSSIIGLSGMQRNGWYGFSNEALSLILAAFREKHPEPVVLSMAFSIWDEVGMGARMGSTTRLAKLGIDSIPVAEGVGRFLRLFMNDPGVGEVATTARVSGLDTWRPPDTPVKPDSFRFLEQIVACVPGVETIVRVRLTLERDPYLKDHVWRGTNLFPTVFGLEAMAQAVAHVTGESDFSTVRIEDVDLERPIVVDSQSGATIEIRAEVLERGDLRSGRRVKAEIAVEQTGFARAHFSAVFVLGNAAEVPVIDLKLPVEPLDIEPKRDLYGWLLFQGNAFQRILKVYSLDSGSALIASGMTHQAEEERGADRWLLGDAYFRDSMLQSVQLPLSRDLCLPVALDRIERFGVAPGLSESAFILTVVEERRDQEVFATITAIAGDGRVLERIGGRMRILEHRSENPAPEELAALGKPGQPAGGLEVTRLNDGKPVSEEADPAEFALSFSHGAAIERGDDGRSVLAVRFPVTFREASNLSRTLHFSHYFSWIGKLRETIVEPVSKEMVDLFSTGEWGMVTNSAETIIGAEAGSGDVIEGRAWIESLTGTADSTVGMRFEWYKLLPNKEAELIATGKMSSTWVAIRGHGIVEVQPFPEFGRSFLQRFLPPPARGDTPAIRTEDPCRVDLGRELFSAPPGPASAGCLLKELEFETSLEDANLVGNLYFANYSAWQGRVRDRYFHELKTKSGGLRGEIRCTTCRVEHLQEAMPFDRILVRMYLRAVYERGVGLYFDYFRLAPDGQRSKIGFGEQQAAWFESGVQGKWKPTELPAELRIHLVPEMEKSSTRRKARSENYDVVVVGAGVGGLTAAALLAKRGRKVVVLEQHNKPGGFCTSWARTVPNRSRDGGKPLRFIFDAGVQDVLGLTPGGNVHKLQQELDIAHRIEWRRVTHEYIQSDLRLKVPWSQEAFREELASRFPSERQGLSALFAEIEACNRAIYQQGPSRENTSSPSGNALARWSNTPFTTMLRTYIRDDRLNHLLGVLSHYISDDPATLDALSMCPVLAYYTQGGYYPLGGAQVFPDVLVSVIKEHGGELRLRAPVSRILVEQGRASSVRLADGSVLRAGEVIANTDVRRTYLELVGREHLDRHFAQRIESLQPSCSAFMVLLGLDFVPEVEPLAVVIADDGTATQVGTLSKVDPSLAPPGHSRVLLSSLIPHAEAGLWKRGTPDYAARKRQYGDALIRIAEKAIPELGKHIVFREDASPATFARYAWTTDGAIYGLDMKDWHPSIKTPIRNLFMVGAGVAPRPGVEDAVRTGMRTADAIQEAVSAGRS